MGKIEGKVGLVTGGNSGIGLATAREFVAEGASVFITGRRESQLAAAVAEIGRNICGIRAVATVRNHRQKFLGHYPAAQILGYLSSAETEMNWGLKARV